jgi:hypothetical protein
MFDAADDAQILCLAEALYAARAALAECNGRPERIGAAELVRFLQRPDYSLSTSQQRALFASPRLRADYALIKSRLARLDLPALVAASSGRVTSRQFQGGSVHIHPSRVEDQTYVIVRIHERQKSPHSMLLEGAQGEIVKRALPLVDSKGEIMLILDRKIPCDEAFLRLISDPTSVGSLLLS